MSSVKKYLLFAVGAITLLFLGILLIMQISNWNEERKDDNIEVSYLKDIKDDLRKDTIELNRIISSQRGRLSIYKLLDPTFYLPEDMTLPTEDTSFEFKRLFDRGRSYRPTKGSYSSLISDGDSKLIENRVLFSHIIQQIGEELAFH